MTTKDYGPLMAVLMILSEQSVTAVALLRVCGAMFTLGRLAHGLCFGFMKHSMVLRTGGMVLSLAALGAIAIALLLTILYTRPHVRDTARNADNRWQVGITRGVKL